MGTTTVTTGPGQSHDSAGEPHTPGLSRRRALGLGGAAFAALPFLAACSAAAGGSGSSSGGGASSRSGASASGGTGGSGKSVTVGIASPPDTLDPGATGLALTLFLSFTMFDPLVWWLPTASGSAYYPGLATSYTVSPDATTYTFKLRTGVTFHDGTVFDAAAVKATYDHVVDPATKSRSGLGALGPYKETKILDSHTCQIIFTQPNAGFLHQQAAGNFGIASPTALKKYGPTGFGNHPVGTGPFVFGEYQSGDHLTVTRNPKYTWGPPVLGTSGPAALEKITFKVLADDSGRYNALQSGQIQLAMSLPPNVLATVIKAGTFDQYTLPSIGTPSGLPINVTKPPTDDLRVRQAIQYAVDQDTLVNQVLFGTYKAAHSVLTPTTPGYSAASAKLYSYDPAKARSLLAAAGWAGETGTRKKAGQDLHLDLLYYTGGGLDVPMQFIGAELEKVGFSVTTNSGPFTSVATSFNKGAQNLAAFGYFGTDPYLLNIWVNSDAIKSGFNWSHYANPKVDAAIAKANATAADASRNAQYEAVCLTLMQDAMYLPLWDVNFPFTAVKGLTGLKPTLNAYELFNAAQLT